MLRKILTFFHKETVLSISAILAILSMFIVHPSGKYFSYIDFRTLSLLFCLMSIVAGLSEIGLFDYLAEKILSRANSIKSIIVLLVLLCFFFSMIITNDVALITFVPLAIIILKKNVRKAKELLDFKNGCYADNCRKSRQYADSHRKSSKSLFICQSQYVCISTHPTHAALFYCSLGAASYMDTDCCA